MNANLSNYSDTDESLAASRKKVFEEASLDTPSFIYDIPAYVVGSGVALTFLAIPTGFAPLAFLLTIAGTPLAGVFGVTEIGVAQARKIRASINAMIEREPDKLTEEQLITVAHAINETFVSPLWPLKPKLLRKEVADLRDALGKLPNTKTAAETRDIMEKIRPVFLSWEPENNDFTLKNVFKNQYETEQRGYDERALQRQKKREARTPQKPNSVLERLRLLRARASNIITFKP